MASNTVIEGLQRYEIGRKVHALRMKKKMGLVELGKHTGFSAALLSKIESSKMFPPLGTLLRIAMVFGVGLDHFFTDAREKPARAVVRKSDRMRFPSAGKQPSYFFESLDFLANDRSSSAYLADFQPVDPAKNTIHEHPGSETIYVMSGKLAIAFGSDEHILGPGDSIYFDSSVPHAYRRIGGADCRAVVFTAE